MKRTLLLRVRAALAEAGDPRVARGAQAYMKSAMPYHGVAVPKMRAVAKSLLAEYPFESARAWRADVLAIWRGARFREERYIALELAVDKRARALQDLDALPMYEEMIVTGAWWDTVDVIAPKLVGELLRRHPAELRKVLLAWSKSDDLWKRRSAILAQLDFKDETDFDLLCDCIEPSLASREFFLRKAIGWALRQHARVDPKEVVRFVRAKKGELSPLSKREALKALLKAGAVARVP